MSSSERSCGQQVGRLRRRPGGSVFADAGVSGPALRKTTLLQHGAAPRHATGRAPIAGPIRNSTYGSSGDGEEHLGCSGGAQLTREGGGKRRGGRGWVWVGGWLLRSFLEKPEGQGGTPSWMFGACSHVRGPSTPTFSPHCDAPDAKLFHPRFSLSAPVRSRLLS